MAGFEGIEWAPGQLKYTLKTKDSRMEGARSKTYAVSRSIHYGVFLAFEGIRFFVRKDNGHLKAVFLNHDKNIARFKAGITYNLGPDQQNLVPTEAEIEAVLLQYLCHPKLRRFFAKMTKTGKQGYLRPFTCDDEQSIGVTFPGNPVIRVVGAQYTSYLGEPFDGVVIPHLIRTVGLNATGCLKLGNNYLMSLKAMAEAKKLVPGVSSALFLDDRPYEDLMTRNITEWDSSCCLIALRDGSVIKIPESNLILPSVTISGIVKILKQFGVKVNERNINYGEFLDLVKTKQVVTVCSIGTAGILNRCRNLTLIDNNKKKLAVLTSDESHPLFETLKRAKDYYWDIYKGGVEAPAGMNRLEYDLERIC